MEETIYGIQDVEIQACPKHFIGNEQENQRQPSIPSICIVSPFRQIDMINLFFFMVRNITTTNHSDLIELRILKLITKKQFFFIFSYLIINSLI